MKWGLRYVYGAGIAWTAAAFIQERPFWWLAICMFLIALGANGWQDDRS